MSDDLLFDLSGVGLRLREAPEGCVRHFHRSWAAFSVAASARPAMDAVIRVAGPPCDGRRISPRPLRSEFAESSASFSSEEGSVEVDRSGGAEITLRPGGDAMQFFSLINLLMPALAWLLPARGKLVLHAAGLIVHGSGLVLVGPAGSGKSTWVALGRERGATPLSDDVLLLDVRPGAPAALGAPFRTKDFGSTGPGRWPLAALLLPVHGKAPSLAPVPAMAARARLAGNLPYIGSRALSEDPVASLIEVLVSSVPTQALTFCREPSFYPLLERLARARELG